MELAGVELFVRFFVGNFDRLAKQFVDRFGCNYFVCHIRFAGRESDSFAQFQRQECNFIRTAAAYSVAGHRYRNRRTRAFLAL